MLMLHAYACTYVKIRRHQRTPAYTRTQAQARGATPELRGVSQTPHIPRPTATACSQPQAEAEASEAGIYSTQTIIGHRP